VKLIRKYVTNITIDWKLLLFIDSRLWVQTAVQRPDIVATGQGMDNNFH